jgi:hypothetical protein
VLARAASKRKTVEFTVELGPRQLGRISGPSRASARTLWPEAVEIAACSLRVSEEDIYVSSVRLGSKKSLTITEASTRTLASLSNENAHIVVASRVAEPAEEAKRQSGETLYEDLLRSITDLQADLQADRAKSTDAIEDLKADRAKSNAKLESVESELESVRAKSNAEPEGLKSELESVRAKSNAELEGLKSELESVRAKSDGEIQDLKAKIESLESLKRTLMRIHLRTLLDAVREQLYGGRVPQRLKGLAWNSWLERNMDDLLLKGSSASLTKEDLRLTRYGEGTMQLLANTAAHAASAEDLSASAEAGGPGYQRLFFFTYGRRAADVGQ